MELQTEVNFFFGGENWKKLFCFFFQAHIDQTTFVNYLEEFFTTSDDAESIVVTFFFLVFSSFVFHISWFPKGFVFFQKSLQVLGDPENVTEEMLSQPPLTEEDIAYLMAKAEDGSLAGFINSSFAC